MIESVGAASSRNDDLGPSAARLENLGRSSGMGYHSSGMRMFQPMTPTRVPPVDGVPRFDTTAADTVADTAFVAVGDLGGGGACRACGHVLVDADAQDLLGGVAQVGGLAETHAVDDDGPVGGGVISNRSVAAVTARASIGAE